MGEGEGRGGEGGRTRRRMGREVEERGEKEGEEGMREEGMRGEGGGKDGRGVGWEEGRGLDGLRDGA